MERERSRRPGVSRRQVIRGGVLGATGIVSLGVFGCTTPTASPTAVVVPTTPPGGAAPVAPVASPTAARPTPKYGGTHRETAGTSDTPNLDPHLVSTVALQGYGPGIAWSQLLYHQNGPDVSMPTFVVAGDLAEKWDQPDDTNYVFTLRPGVKFHNIAPVNGREVDAEDVVKSFQRQVDQKVNAGFFAGVINMTAPSKNTVRITLDKPNADFLWSLANTLCKVLPKEQLGGADLREGPVIGSGPFIMGDWQRGSSVKMLRNPDYYQKGKPYLDSLHYFRVSDAAFPMTAMRAQQLDSVSVISPADAETLRKERPELVVRTLSSGARMEYGLKGDRPPFNNARVRQAMFKAINRQEIIDTVLDGAADVVAGLTLGSPDQALPQDELKRLYAYDPDGARRLLQEAGVTSVEAEFQVANFATFPMIAVAELMQSQLRRVNINLNLRVVESTAFLTQIRVQGEYTAYLGLQASNAPTGAELLTRHHSKGSQFTTGIADAELDAMIERQSGMVRDPQGRARLIQDIQRKMIGLYGYNMIVMQKISSISWPYVKDRNPNATVYNTQGDFIWVWHDK